MFLVTDNILIIKISFVLEKQKKLIESILLKKNYLTSCCSTFCGLIKEANSGTGKQTGRFVP